jgi:ParB family chromosome partitioning protein
MRVQETSTVELISLDRITVVNPRVRNRRGFEEIVQNIETLGLKRPVTVTRRPSRDGPRYDLVCGQGRLEAYRSLGQTEIPAIVVEADQEETLVMSLVENIARRQHRAIDLLHDIEGMKRRGYTEEEIARKTGLSVEYAKGIIRLLETGEDRLLRAVESGHIPVSVAVQIAEAADDHVQEALQQAYERGDLRGKRLLITKRLVEQRRRRGKGLGQTGAKRQQNLSPHALIRTYRADVEKKRLLVRKAEATRDRLVFATQALKTLFKDEHFVTLLRAEGLDTLPRNLALRLQSASGA